MPVPGQIHGWPLFHLTHLWWAGYPTKMSFSQKNLHIPSAAPAPAGLMVVFLRICVTLLKICTSFWSNFTEQHTITRTKTHTHAHTQSPRPGTCTHSQHDRIGGVCLVREEKWAEIRSCDPPVCLCLYHSNLTAVILFKQRQMASGKVRKSLSPSLSLIPLSIYVPLSASSYLSVLSRILLDKKKASKLNSTQYTLPFGRGFAGLLYSTKQEEGAVFQDHTEPNLS